MEEETAGLYKHILQTVFSTAFPRTSQTSQLPKQIISTTMALCGPSCTIPSCASAPSVGFGSAGVGGLTSGSLGLSPFGESSGSLGTLAGIVPSCINQIPAAELVIQPPSVLVTIPGPILSATCEPVAVGGNTPCAASGQGLPLSLGGQSRLGGGRYGLVGNRGSICYTPC